MLVFVHILIAIANPVTVCQITNILDSSILYPLNNVINKEIARVISPVILSPNLRLSILMKILFMSNLKNPVIINVTERKNWSEKKGE